MKYFTALLAVALLSLSSMTFAAEPTTALVSPDDVVKTFQSFAGDAAQKAGMALEACNEGAMRVMMAAQENRRKDLGPKLEALYPKFQEAMSLFQVADAKVRIALYDVQAADNAGDILRAAATIADTLELFKTAEDAAHAVLEELGELFEEAQKPPTKEA